MGLARDQKIWGLLRLAMGWTFFWAFIDKLLGLGFTTAPDKSWLAGGSPTSGFLGFGTHGPLASFYQALAGNLFIDVLFMIGLLLIGLALIFGIGIRIAGYTGALLMFLMWTALLPPEHNPIIDEHIIQLLVLLGLTTVKSGHWFGLGKWWSEKFITKNHPILE